MSSRGTKRRQKKDPNAPKRPLSGFFFFCAEERPKVRTKMPDAPVSEIAKELGKRWAVCKDKPKYEAMNVKDKERYEKECAAYKKGGKVASKASSPKKAKKQVQEDDDEDDDDDDDDDE
ncbi:high mobility group-T protein-like [Gigantopelta aegis]|uniref:high mobility group-T protein-like n=1 Tax=Gigantopelta aegis TaxID=1735272 RepID=UPI001B88901F|nr:high mobility group-T protein-like [Gigantopelta aegis]